MNEVAAAAAAAAAAGSAGGSNGLSSVGNGSAPTENSCVDDAVYCNKQLTAHLLRRVCSPSQSHGSSRGFSGGSSVPNGGRRVGVHSSSGSDANDSSRSRSPEEENGELHHNLEHHQHQQHQHQRQQAQRQPRHFDSLDGVTAPSSDYLTASSASGASLSAQSASPAYVSPFAMSPLSEASPWSQPAISLAVLNDARTAEVERVLLELCAEFEERLHHRFQNFSARLDTEPATIRDSVTSELNTLFYDDNIHWGRVIAVFVLAKEICDKCHAESRPQVAAAVQQWVAEFIDQHLWDWVRRNQGWYGLIKFYKDTGGQQRSYDEACAGDAARSGLWHPLASLLALSAVSITVALVAAYFRR